MTSRQAELINIMLSQHYNSATYKDAYSELRGTCSDALVHPTVTVSASGTANQPPPSTPKPLGPEWWKERQAEALQEQIDIIADKNLKIETLNNQVALLMKRIKEDREHWDNKAVIDNGIREHNNELVAANGEIYEALRHWGLEQSEPCSLVNNVKHVIQLCAERGKRCDEQGAEIKELKKDRNASIIASNQILGALNQTSLRQYDGSLADNVVDVIKQCVAQEKKISTLERVSQLRQQYDETDRVLMEKKDKEIESLKKQIEVRLHFTQQDREIIAKRNTEIADLRKQVSTLSKQISQRDMTIAVLNKQIDQTDKLCDEEILETEDLKKQLVVAGKKRKSIVDVGNNLREVMAVIINNYSLDFGDGLLAKNAIALWEDNTTP